MGAKGWCWVAVLGVFALTAGCATMVTPEKSLYERLGGKAAIEAVVDDVVARLAADPRILANERVKKRLEAIHVPSLKIHFVNQLCEAAGGPCKYTGRDMKMAHAGLEITSREFDITVEHLVASLDKFRVGEREKKEILALLGPMKKDIVERR